MLKNSFDFKLDHPVNAGKISELVLYAPRNVHRPITARLDGMLRGGILSLSKLNPTPSDSVSEVNESGNPFDEMSALQVTEMLKMVPSDDYTFYPSFCDEFKALMTSDNICKIKEGDVKLVSAFYDQMTSEDGDRLMGDYIKHFFTISTSS